MRIIFFLQKKYIRYELEYIRETHGNSGCQGLCDYMIVSYCTACLKRSRLASEQKEGHDSRLASEPKVLGTRRKINMFARPVLPSMAQCMA